MNATATLAPASPQHLRALERANEVRLARAELKRAVAEGRVDVAQVILDRCWETENMTLADLLGSQRRWGHTRVRRFLTAIPLAENKVIGTMTDRQRHALAECLQAAQANSERARESASRHRGSSVAAGRAPAALV